MDHEPFSFETTGYAMEDDGYSPPRRDSMRRSSPPHPATSNRSQNDEHRPVAPSSQQYQATADDKALTSPSTLTSTQEQNEALYHYARSLLRSEHQRKHEKLTYNQELEIENLMFLLSRDSKEMCEVVLEVVDGGTVGQKDDVRKLEGVSDEDGGGGGVVRPIGVTVKVLLGVLALIALWLWLKQFDVAERVVGE